MRPILALFLLVGCALVNNNAYAGAWTNHANGTLQTADNAAPGMPTFTAGDVLTLWSVAFSGANQTLSTPAGWTLLTSFTGGTGLNGYLFCRVAVGGDTAPTIDWSGTPNVLSQISSWSGPTAPDCSTILHTSSASGYTAGVFATQGVTPTHDNTLILSVNIKTNGGDGTATDYGTLSCPSNVNGGNPANRSQLNAGLQNAMACYVVQTTATAIANSTIGITGTQESDNGLRAIFSLERQDASAPTFSVTPTYATVSNTQISATFTANAASESYYCALYAPGATAPTAAEVAAGTNAHSAVITGTTTGASETHNMTSNDSPAFPKYDPYCVLLSGAYSAVPTTTTTATNPPTGYQYVTLASVTATGSLPKAYNATNGLITLAYKTQTANFTVGSLVVDSTSGAWGYIRADSDAGATGTLTIDKRNGTFANNDALYDQGGAVAVVDGAEAAYTLAATSDVLVPPTTVSPSSAALTVDTSGQYSYTASGRQSALTGRIFHAATAAYLSLPIDAWFNNTAPHCSTSQTAVFKNGTAIDFDLASLCGDDDNDTLSYARITSLPTGATINPTTGHVTGTVTADGTTSVNFIVYDQTGDYATQAVTMTVQTTWSVPNCAGLTSSACANQIIATTLGRVNVHFAYQCSATIASGSVISQSPASGATVAPGDTETITSSVGNVCSIKSPDCTSSATTLTACQDLYTAAFSSLVSFAATARCDATVPANDVISTFPRANVEIPANATVSMLYSLGTCSTTYHPMVNCIAHTTDECLALLNTRFGTAASLVSQAVTCPTGYTSGEIFSQSPSRGTKTYTPAALNVRYCL